MLRALGSSLAGMRRARGLTGEALGGRVGFSQAKISKIERGTIRPSPADVEAIALALEAPSATIEDLVGFAARLQAPSHPRRTQARRGSYGQQDYAVIEAQAKAFKVFECTVVPGLLQISEYTRPVVAAYYDLVDDVEPNAAETAATVSQRAQRQEQLYDSTRTFDFVVFETVLLHRYTTPGHMLAQVDRIESVASLPNVTVRIVPVEAQLGFPPLHGFAVLDDEQVLTEVAGETNILRDPGDVAFYRRSFEHYAALGTSDLMAVLIKYKMLYADLARPR